MISTIKSYVVTMFCNIFFLSRPSRWSTNISKQLSNLAKIINFDTFSFSLLTPNPLLLWRAETFFEKEPETLRWIESFKPDETLFDIGANVGLFSIYAGKRNIKVFAFEPESSNYYLLNQNILNNELSDKIKAFNLALSNIEEFSTLSLTTLIPGAAHTLFNENQNPFKQTKSPTQFQQGCFGTTLNNLILKYNLPFPNHIKIDVDGVEHLIIEGASQVIQDKRLKSILIEIDENLPKDLEIVSTLSEYGFNYQSYECEDSSIENKKIKNYIFQRP